MPTMRIARSRSGIAKRYDARPCNSESIGLIFHRPQFQAQSPGNAAPKPSAIGSYRVEHRPISRIQFRVRRRGPAIDVERRDEFMIVKPLHRHDDGGVSE